MNSEVTNVTWTGPDDLDEVDGYIIAMYLRLKASGGLVTGERMCIPPTALNEARVNQIAEAYAYMRDMVRLHNLKTIEEVDSFISLHESEEAFDWVMKNDVKIEVARNDLMKMVGRFLCYG